MVIPSWRIHASIAAYPHVVSMLSLPHSSARQPLDVENLEEVCARNRAVPVDVGVFDEQSHADIAAVPCIREPPMIPFIVVDFEVL